MGVVETKNATALIKFFSANRRKSRKKCKYKCVDLGDDNKQETINLCYKQRYWSGSVISSSTALLTRDAVSSFLFLFCCAKILDSFIQFSYSFILTTSWTSLFSIEFFVFFSTWIFVFKHNISVLLIIHWYSL